MQNRTEVAVIQRSDYARPDFLIHDVVLTFDLALDRTLVKSRMAVRRAPETPKDRPLILDGEGLELLSTRIDGEAATSAIVSRHHLTIEGVPDVFDLEIETACSPVANSSLTGLYASAGGLFTQCEPEGFRRITYFLDRPDVMATYTVTLRADRTTFPVLLSNGNLTASGSLDNGRHYAVWEDPFRKPSYLFAIVAGKFVAREERITTASGKEKLLQIWSEPRDLPRTGHAMASLINAIRWDEHRFGLELDLERFMIVAATDFNMGAMENKGLNVFNAKFLLADPDTATDADYERIESIVGHEYFHNWTGNRVTCRDWFQLSLKEGLTVFRDQEFSADMSGDPAGRSAERIASVRALRRAQFAEDASPMAHPVRPEAYAEINNFYTPTVYDKGAEVVRMYQTLLGRDGFRSGMKLYFDRHDGCAVTCDDFRMAMADANNRDLTQFERWYDQARTPRVSVDTHYDEPSRRFTLNLRQHYAHCVTGTGLAPRPFHIPFAFGLVGADGCDVPLWLEGEANPGGTTRVLELSEETQQFTFVGVAPGCLPSLLRGFSAPVSVDYDYSDEQLAFLLSHDSDAFNRWEAGQKLFCRELLRLAGCAKRGEPLEITPNVVDAVAKVLRGQSQSPKLLELILTLPSESYLVELTTAADPAAVRAAHKFLSRTLATTLSELWLDIYHSAAAMAADTSTSQPGGARALKNLALRYLAEIGSPAGEALVRAQYADATNITDRIGALFAGTIGWNSSADELLDGFYLRFEREPLVVDKWFMLQALRPGAPDGGALVHHIRKLMGHPSFTLKNPNRMRSLIFSFCDGNPSQFHASDGAGYELWQELVAELDAINPQMAAQLARKLEGWRKYTPALREKMTAALSRLNQLPLSRNTTEIVSKALSIDA
ncbi:aminopeptidase N [Pandoraea thiooxydans]|uniref:Aminopeptidase N n=1 Tax=Pandoraea thiooxydans TaxID=445709 RepID=A0A0G3EPM0_9BURK|nr:aminopeptidase N [Pandoraea thiooxydans]AKJ67292.1 aminopeptidase N [Pandoraea thiooxydans]